MTTRYLSMPVSIPESEDLARTLHVHYPPLAAISWDGLSDQSREWLLAMADAALECFADLLEANSCQHDSASGIDATPINDAAKVWRCDHCGLRWTSGDGPS